MVNKNTKVKSLKIKKKQSFWKLYFKELKKNLKSYYSDNKLECIWGGISIILWILGLKKKRENKKKVKFYDSLRDGRTYINENDEEIIVTLNKDHSITAKYPKK